jgi:hypothetical protein
LSSKIKKALTILLAVMFVVSLTAAAAVGSNGHHTYGGLAYSRLGGGQSKYDYHDQTRLYRYTVTNSGNADILGNIMITDNRTGNISIPNNNLGSGKSVTTTANYTIQQPDIGAGSVTNSAYATNQNNNINSNTVNATVTTSAQQRTSTIVVNINPHPVLANQPFTTTATLTDLPAPGDFVVRVPNNLDKWEYVPLHEAGKTVSFNLKNQISQNPTTDQLAIKDFIPGKTITEKTFTLK